MRSIFFSQRVSLRPGLLVLVLALCLAPFAQAQQRASAKLFARQIGDQVQAAAEIKVDAGWYIYHTEIDPNGFGVPLKFAWSGTDLAFGAPVLPEPQVKKIDDPDLGKYTDFYHKGTVTVWFQAPGPANLDDLIEDLNPDDIE